jgi:hypothetical protein
MQEKLPVLEKYLSEADCLRDQFHPDSESAIRYSAEGDLLSETIDEVSKAVFMVKEHIQFAVDQLDFLENGAISPWAKRLNDMQKRRAESRKYPSYCVRPLKLSARTPNVQFQNPSADTVSKPQLSISSDALAATTQISDRDTVQPKIVPQRSVSTATPAQNVKQPSAYPVSSADTELRSKVNIVSRPVASAVPLTLDIHAVQTSSVGQTMNAENSPFSDSAEKPRLRVKHPQPTGYSRKRRSGQGATVLYVKTKKHLRQARASNQKEFERGVPSRPYKLSELPPPIQIKCDHRAQKIARITTLTYKQPGTLYYFYWERQRLPAVT